MTNLRGLLSWACAGLIAGGIALSPAPLLAENLCRADEVIVTSPDAAEANVVRFSVEIADDAEERALGLMNRPEMARSHGMLFVYEKPQPVAFWMANTLIPLDMIFVDQRGVVTRVHEEAIPLDRTAIPGGDAVFAVLEINGGLAKALDIRPGDVLRHPAFGNDAADPCFK
ncbi:DUF192 domain-containing protein [Celeribacter halophilus]|uniref:DUF192 domain-containing protein n=1 Tax=Celeribacter halophilus TaxID=576117 RepID=A0AAW7XS18_9RHOB|nr:DUF192 domain-containing protein [Celeribacter halophilus]MDO6455887.1 DUF192 domain-containing protein [Celeribacter halophilus]MDO6722075.1 DUF192 domain-containing protein [Celeribacter halophilus]